MTRIKFLGDMLKSVFGVKYIIFDEVSSSTVTYEKGGNFLKDCTYTSTYKEKAQQLFGKLLDERINKILFKKDKYSKPQPIDKYREKAKTFIFGIKIFNNVDSEYLNVIKENITITMVNRIYQDIIIEEVFNIGDKKGFEERKNDNFDESVDNIGKSIFEFIRRELPKIISRKYETDLLKHLTQNYPVFSKLQLDEKNKLVFDDVEMIKKFIENSKKIPLSTFGLEFVDTLSIREETLIRNGKLATYIDKSIMNAVDFELLTSVITDLYHYSECYPQVFSEKEVETLTNTAIRTYNHFYGKNHVVYSGKVNSQHWDMHQHLIEYLFMLQLVMKSKQSTDYDDKKVKEWYK